MGLDHEACENCAQSTNDEVPNKKIRLGSEVNLLTQLNTQQLSINKIMDTKRHKKVTSRKLSSASPKKDAGRVDFSLLSHLNVIILFSKETY